MAERTKGATVGFRITSTEREALAALAEARGVTLSELARHALLKELRPEPAGLELRHTTAHRLKLLLASLEAAGGDA
jgi:hypothetical protein